MVAIVSLLFVTSVTLSSNFSLLLPRMTLQNRNQIATFWTPFDGGCFAQATAVRRSKEISVILLCDCGDYLRITADGRAKNRRVDIRLMTNTGADATTPAQAPSSSPSPSANANPPSM